MKDLLTNDTDERADALQSGERIGKFESAAALLSAYNALESEFTKRCQLIKQLQADARHSSAQAEDRAAPQAVSPPSGENAPPDAASDAAEQEADAPCACGDGADDNVALADNCGGGIAAHAAELADELSRIPEVMDACIARYKQRLLDMRVGGVAFGGAAVITPAKRPRTLAEAKSLADELLSNGR